MISMLRLHASYGAKITKNQTPLYVLLHNFLTRPSFKKTVFQKFVQILKDGPVVK